MLALEIERAHDDHGEPCGVRALVYDIDEEPPHYNLVLDIVEGDSASEVVLVALSRAPDICGGHVTHAKCGHEVVEPDCLTVGETARAMAGIW